MSAKIDLNYEEISPERQITDGYWANGLHNYRFSVASSGGGTWIPHMSYFLVEYAFGAYGANQYSPNGALPQSSKITLQNDFMGSMFTAASFKMAGTDICSITSNHAHCSVLQKRLRLSTEFIENVGPDLNGFDPDFSRRLAKFCKDGVYHRDGLIDCSPYNSQPLGPNSGNLPLFNQLNEPLQDDDYYIGTGQNHDISFPTTDTDDTDYIFKTDYDFKTFMKGNDAGEVVTGLMWVLPQYSAKARVSGSPSENATTNSEVINGLLLQVGDIVYFDMSKGVAPDPIDADFTTANDILKEIPFRIGKLKNGGHNNEYRFLYLTPVTDGSGNPENLNGQEMKNLTINYDNGNGPAGAIVRVVRNGSDLYVQADPRSNVVNNMVFYQPPLAVFSQGAGKFYGDMQFQFTPNSNWAKSAIESAKVGWYGEEPQHGVDYSFGIKSMRFYIARCKINSSPPQELQFKMPDMLIANKSISSGSQNIDFIIPPSTKKIAIFIQDTSAGSNSRIPLSRFKTRQYTNDATTTYGVMTPLNQFGPWAHTYDEQLRSLQVTFAGITKPMSNFMNAENGGNITDPTMNSMLQRWVMTNQNNDSDFNSEKYHDWLSMGPYYLYDFSRDANNTGTYLQVKINYANSSLPGSGNSRTDMAKSTVNLFVCALYERNVGLKYSQYGQVIAAQTEMA